MTSINTSHPMIRRPSKARMLAIGALTVAGAGLAVDQANAASAQVQSTTLVVTGDNVKDRIALRLEVGVPTNVQVDFNDDGTAEGTFDRSTFDRVLVRARGGRDQVRIDEANGVFTDTELTTIDGGSGNDTLLGGRGIETFIAGPGYDTVDGNQGNDVAFMGSGNDTFIWDPGDGSDVIEGQSGYDTMDFRGSNGDEVFEASANGPRLRFFRNLGNINMDTDGVERVKLETLGGADTVTVNDLRATDVRRFHVDLASALGATIGHGNADAVIVNATPDDDSVSIRPENGRVWVRGLSPTVVIANSEAANDSLTLNTLGGDDEIRLGRGLSAAIRTTING